MDLARSEQTVPLKCLMLLSMDVTNYMTNCCTSWLQEMCWLSTERSLKWPSNPIDRSSKSILFETLIRMLQNASSKSKPMVPACNRESELYHWSRLMWNSESLEEMLNNYVSTKPWCNLCVCCARAQCSLQHYLPLECKLLDFDWHQTETWWAIWDGPTDNATTAIKRPPMHAKYFSKR